MTLYARDDELLRSRQIIADALVATWVVAWVLVGRALQDLIDGLAVAGRLLEDAGADFAGSAGGTGERVGDLPVVGDRLAAPFSAVADGGIAMANAGAAQQDAVATLALVLGVLVAALPIAWLLATYLPGRLRWTRSAAAAGRLLDTSDVAPRLFALRALATRPLPQLRRVSADPFGDFERGDVDVVALLAALELRPLGLRLAPGRRVGGGS